NLIDACVGDPHRERQLASVRAVCYRLFVARLSDDALGSSYSAVCAFGGLTGPVSALIRAALVAHTGLDERSIDAKRRLGEPGQSRAAPSTGTGEGRRRLSARPESRPRPAGIRHPRRLGRAWRSARIADQI